MKTYCLIIALFSIVALSASALPPPEKDELTITELATKLFDLEGKIVETEITRANYLDQVAKGEYRIYCYYYKGTGSSNGEYVTFGEDGKEFFEEMTKKGYGGSSTETVYLFVEDGKLKAIGTRFNKSKGIYSW